MYDIRNLQWDKKILEYLGIPKSILPEVMTSFPILDNFNIKDSVYH